MSKKYLFTNDSYFDSPWCSCCAYLVELYNSDDTDCNLGSAHSYEECYVQAIVSSLGGQSVVSDEMLEELWCMDIKDLKSMCKDLCIRVEIV